MEDTCLLAKKQDGLEGVKRLNLHTICHSAGFFLLDGSGQKVGVAA
jgi:hypothetical protein